MTASTCARCGIQVERDSHRTCVRCRQARDRLRSARKREVRAVTIGARSGLTKLAQGRVEFPPTDEPRPRTRGECVDSPRPCPWVGCRHHLYLDVSPRTGSLKLNFPDLEVDELADSCALDVADEDGATLERVAEAMNVTRERARQLVMKIGARLSGETFLEDHHAE